MKDYRLKLQGFNKAQKISEALNMKERSVEMLRENFAHKELKRKMERAMVSNLIIADYI